LEGEEEDDDEEELTGFFSLISTEIDSNEKKKWSGPKCRDFSKVKILKIYS